MHLDTIEKMWAADAPISPADLTNESLRVPVLHNKYYKLLGAERIKLLELQQEYDALELEKRQFYLYGSDEYSRKKGWQERPQGRVLKAELPPVLAADSDLGIQKLRIAIQSEKVQYLEEIVKQINNRSYHINNAIKNELFKHGINV